MFPPSSPPPLRQNFYGLGSELLVQFRCFPARWGRGGWSTLPHVSLSFPDTPGSPFANLSPIFGDHPAVWQPISGLQSSRVQLMLRSTSFEDFTKLACVECMEFPETTILYAINSLPCALQKLIVLGSPRLHPQSRSQLGRQL